MTADICVDPHNWTPTAVAYTCQRLRWLGRSKSEMAVRLPKLFSRRSELAAPQRTEFTARIQPEIAFVAIGDIHGELELLQRAFDNIREAEPDLPIICVGDYIDRGEQSAGVLRLLFQLDTDDAQPISCLLGNHEHMCLRFLDDPERNGRAWSRYGGLQTLASFGVAWEAGNLTAVRDSLVKEMGKALIDWLRSLPSQWITGNVVVTHAGADPYKPIQSQSRRALLWGHPDFEQVSRTDGMWIVHGHTIVDKPIATRGRIAIDTGAYATGRLTAAKVSPEGVSFMTIAKHRPKG